MQNRYLFLLLGLVFLMVLTTPTAWAHGGGLNRCGCHIERATNTCHCHRAPYGGCGPECYSRLRDTEARLFQEPNLLSPSFLSVKRSDVISVECSDESVLNSAEQMRRTGPKSRLETNSIKQ